VNQKTDIEMERERLMKTVRKAIRHKHSLLADAEINEILPGIVEEFEKRVAAGQSYQLDIASVFE